MSRKRRDFFEKEQVVFNGMGEKSNIPIRGFQFLNKFASRLVRVAGAEADQSGGQQWIISNQLEGGVHVPTSGLQLANPKEISENINSG